MIGSTQRVPHLIRASNLARAASRTWRRQAGDLALVAWESHAKAGIADPVHGVDQALARRALRLEQLANVAADASVRMMQRARGKS